MDFDLIVHELPADLTHINVYPIGDLHYGSEELCHDSLKRWMDVVENDPNGYVVIVGDMIENGLKNSKTDSYRATMPPMEQKRELARLLKPIKHKILGAVSGNHEYRSVYLADDCPLYDVMSKLDLEDYYAPEICFLKINLGYKNKERQYSYTMVLSHGGSRNKAEKFSYAIDGMDIFVSGHTHTPSVNFPAKIVIDSKNNVVKMSGYTHLVVPSFAKFGGYVAKGLYMPQSHDKIPVIRLDGTKKGVEVKWM